jgi:hypothetical protein
LLLVFDSNFFSIFPPPLPGSYFGMLMACV